MVPVVESRTVPYILLDLDNFVLLQFGSSSEKLGNKKGITAAPVINVKTHILPIMSHDTADIECVKVIAPTIISLSGITLEHPVIINGQSLPIKIDALGCDPTMTESAQPWILSLVDRSQGDTIKLADVTTDNQVNYNWLVNSPPLQKHDTIDVDEIQPVSESANVNEYFLKVEGLSQSGQRLAGKSDAFVIVNAPILQKRQSDDDSALPGPPRADFTEDVDPTIAAPSTFDSPSFPTPEGTPNDVAQTPNDVAMVPIAEPIANVDPTVLSTPEVATPVIPVNVEPKTTDVLKEVPKPSNLPDNSSAEEGIVYPAKSRLDPFYKYAAAGGALLSLIGLGVGGIVGGLIGGTIGLVAGLILAGINTFILV
ncbi:hypothetical protein BGZ76_005060 [Entomortierella beljakovae]|nr:hypothetical protein BGZ76_005060 [Entomortierella beljakovae]